MRNARISGGRGALSWIGSLKPDERNGDEAQPGAEVVL